LPTHSIKILLIDNLDSFTYNIVDTFEHLGAEVIVGHGPVEGITHLVLGPGPGSPTKDNIRLLHHYLGKVPILGICLGHQTIAAAFGGNIVRAQEPRHGKVESITHDGKGLFQGLSSPLTVTRYHSLVIEERSLPACLEITARSSAGEIMGVRHKDYFLEGVQFHPEAIASHKGSSLFESLIIAKVLGV
jgi:anthranilate synthase/aminodeoxychorismate synthase-like glutamine amidotransferase